MLLKLLPPARLTRVLPILPSPQALLKPFPPQSFPEIQQGLLLLVRLLLLPVHQPQPAVSGFGRTIDLRSEFPLFCQNSRFLWPSTRPLLQHRWETALPGLFPQQCCWFRVPLPQPPRLIRIREFGRYPVQELPLFEIQVRSILESLKVLASGELHQTCFYPHRVPTYRRDYF